MEHYSLTLPFPDVRLTSVTLIDDVWVIRAEKMSNAAICPRCQVVSPVRHSSYQRRFWDLPIQGRPVRITLTVVDGNVATLTAGSPSSPSDCLGWWILVRDRHGVRPAFCACWVTALEGGRAKDWPLGWVLQPTEEPSCGTSYGTSVCPTIPFLG